jgi:hypothetical protein
MLFLLVTACQVRWQLWLAFNAQWANLFQHRQSWLFGNMS